jgi:hypothetical protein
VAEVWLATPGQSDIQTLAGKIEVRSLPVILQMDPRTLKVWDAITGPEASALDQACRALVQRETEFNLPLAAKIEPWFGSLDTKPCITFGQARTKDLGAAAKEPHRRWLLDLVRGTDRHLQLWATTRLVEANAPARPGDPDVWGIFIRDCEQRFRDSVQNRQQESTPVPWLRLGQSGVLDPEAPVWPTLRAMLRSPKVPRVGTTLYALLAPTLLAADRDPIRRRIDLRAGQGGRGRSAFPVRIHLPIPHQVSWPN